MKKTKPIVRIGTPPTPPVPPRPAPGFVVAAPAYSTAQRIARGRR